ncbi:hypothetical protein [Herbiconiux sp. YIM B11900]|uniref:hypothetical protein n=1 Tax=Herbiconiux sp. YIM B11900 TaxID=3404131 RepID=UPI003F85A98C
MSPRAAGVLAIAGSLGLAVLGGWLLAGPPWSIPGAVVLVAATILLSVGTVWLYRRSWSEPWPPDVTPSMQKRMRRIRVLQVVNSVLFVGMVAAAISAIVCQDWTQLAYAGIFLVVGLGNLSMNRRTMRYLRELERHPGSGQ